MTDPIRIFPTEDERRADALFDDLSSALRDYRDTRMSESDLRAQMRHADAAFQALHDWLVAGKTPPSPWRDRGSTP